MYKKWISLSAVMLFMLTGCTMTSGTPQPAPAPSAASSVSLPAPHAIDPASDALWQKALSAYQAWNIEKALQLCDEALQKDPQNYKALSTKGIVTAFASSPEEGAALVQKALAIEPHYTAGFYDMAMALKLGKHYDESIHYFQKVLDADPQNTWSYYGIATIHADRGEKDAALDYLKKAIALDSQSVKAAAAEQSHFDGLRQDRDFQKLMK